MKAFAGTSIYTADDIPKIDYLFITHDHYDHLDYETILGLKDKVTHVVCGLGVGSHFERWGFREDQIIEMDWDEKLEADSTLTIYAESARHKSGRGFTQNNTLWLSFLIKAQHVSIYISGDGGYDDHFLSIGERFGPVDLAIMENGQYDSAWHHVHMLPEETMQAAMDLKARRLLPVHHSKFVLARHAWYEPLERITKLKSSARPVILTPCIGQPINLHDTSQVFTKWWREYNRKI